MKKFILVLSMAVMAFSLISCSDKTTEENVKTLYLAESYPDDHIITKTDYEFARLVEEYSGGTLKVEVQSNGKIGTDNEVKKKIYDGSLDFARISIAAVADETYLPGIVEIPFLFKNSSHMFRALELHILPMLDSALYNYNAKVLSFYNCGARNIYTTNKITSVDDLQNLKINTYAVSNISSNFMTLLNVSPVSSKTDDLKKVYTDLETNATDGAENTLTNYYTSGHYNIAKNVLKVNYKYIPDIFIVSRSIYEGLTEQQREAIKSAATKANIYERTNWDKYEQEIEQKLIDAGCTIESPSNEIIEELETAASYVTKTIQDENQKELIYQISAID